MDLVAFTPQQVAVGLVAGAYPDLMVTAQRASKGFYQILYKPISDPSVYTESPGRGALAKFQAYRPLQQNSALPVYRSASRLTGHFYVVSEASANNNPAIKNRPFSYSVTHSYKDGVQSNLGRGWLGFGSSHHVNHALGRISDVTYNQKFPLIGRIATKTLSCAKTIPDVCKAGNIHHIDHFTYEDKTTHTAPGSGAKAHMVRMKSVVSDKYQGTTYQHSVGQTTTYDTYGNALQAAKLNLVTREGKDIDPKDNVYVNAAYEQDLDKWRLGLVTHRKVTSAGADRNFETFTKDKDFRLETFGYDEHFNPSSHGVWDDQRREFLTTSYKYDTLGNRIFGHTPQRCDDELRVRRYLSDVRSENPQSAQRER